MTVTNLNLVNFYYFGKKSFTEITLFIFYLYINSQDIIY